MTYNDLRRSIYESYQSGEISGPQATQMLEKVMDIEGDHIVAEYEALENTFMGVAMEAANGYMDFSDFQEQAQVYTEGVKEIWDKFVSWLQGIISAIFGIEFKGNPVIPVNAEKVSLYKKFSGLCHEITSGHSAPGIAARIAGIAASIGASIFAGRKVKMTYKKFVDLQATAIKDGSDAAQYIKDHPDASVVTALGASGAAMLTKIFKDFKAEKVTLVGWMRKKIGQMINKSAEKLNAKEEKGADGKELELTPEEEANANAAGNGTGAQAGAQAVAAETPKAEEKPKGEQDAAAPKTDAAAPKGDGSKEQNVNSSAYSDFASGDVLSESSSWDDIFAYMDI